MAGWGLVGKEYGGTKYRVGGWRVKSTEEQNTGRFYAVQQKNRKVQVLAGSCGQWSDGLPNGVQVR
jgi:hypothetical protein